MKAALIALAAFSALSSACAAKRVAPAALPQAAARPSEEEQPAYERILGSFAIEPDLYVYLDPATCLRYFSGARWSAWDMGAIARRMHALGSLRGEAAATLNHGAALWFLGDGESAYRAMMDAERMFAELGDVQGLAHTYDWLGYFFRESHDA